jgi:hypothetical protein
MTGRQFGARPTMPGGHLRGSTTIRRQFGKRPTMPDGHLRGSATFRQTGNRPTVPAGHLRGSTIFRQSGNRPTVPGGHLRGSTIFRQSGKRPIVPRGHSRGSSTLRQSGNTPLVPGGQTRGRQLGQVPIVPRGQCTSDGPQRPFRSTWPVGQTHAQRSMLQVMPFMQRAVLLHCWGSSGFQQSGKRPLQPCGHSCGGGGTSRPHSRVRGFQGRPGGQHRSRMGVGVQPGAHWDGGGGGGGGGGGTSPPH